MKKERYNATACLCAVVIVMMFAIGCAQQPEPGFDEAEFSIERAKNALGESLVECQTAAGDCIINAASAEELIACREELNTCLQSTDSLIGEAISDLEDCREAARACIGEMSISVCRESFEMCVTSVVPIDEILESIPIDLPELGELIPVDLVTECIPKLAECPLSDDPVACLDEVRDCLREGLSELPVIGDLGDLPVISGNFGMECMNEMATCIREDDDTTVAECAMAARECIISNLPVEIPDLTQLIPTGDALACIQEVATCREDGGRPVSCIEQGVECVQALLPELPLIGNLPSISLPLIGNNLGLGCMQGLAECTLGGGNIIECAEEARECLGVAEIIPGLLPGGLSNLGPNLPLLGGADIVSCVADALQECVGGVLEPGTGVISDVAACAEEARACLTGILPGQDDDPTD